MLEIGSVLDGRYKVLEQIGKGGMSVVYMARDEKLSQTCAIKEVRREGVKDFEAVKQGLVAETDILKKLKHPSLPEIRDIINTSDSFVIVMELVDGRDMDKVLAEKGALPEDYVVEWAKQICDVFQYLHTRKPPIIYRDMKPSNIMLKPDGTICIIDFGTAREFKERNVKDTTTLGTVGYAAPEQYGGAGQRQSDARTDIYTLGATIYHLVTGFSPNPSAPPYYGMVPIRQINPSLSKGLEKVILKCCQQKPEDRYQDCMEVMYALEHIGDDELVDRKRFRTFLTTSILCLVMALTGSGFLVAESRLRSSSYGSLVDLAVDRTVEQTDAERYSLCSEAIGINPGGLAAYEAILEICDYDNVVTSAEALECGVIKKNQEEIIRSNSENDYGKLCYDAATSIWFYAEDENSGMSSASDWFEMARNYQQDNALASLYYQVVDWNINIQKRRSSGTDESEDYAQYFQNLESAVTAVEQERSFAQLQIYRTVVQSLSLYAKDFARADIETAQMNALLDRVDEGLKGLSGEFSDKNLERYNNTETSLQNARDAVALVS